MDCPSAGTPNRYYCLSKLINISENHIKRILKKKKKSEKETYTAMLTTGTY